MPLSLLAQVGILIVTTLLSSALAPKVKNRTKSATLEDFDIPLAEEGTPIRAVFGKVRITVPTLSWYGDLYVKTQTKNKVKTKRYYMGLDFKICYGPIDALTAIYVGDRIAWSGSQTSNGTLTIEQPNLFGGMEKEGGIVGYLDLMMGGPAQGANSYLSGVQGTPQPGYRGIVSGVFNRGIVTANTPYVKPWHFEVSRLLAGWVDDSPWYPETVDVLDTEASAEVSEDWSSGLTNYSLVSGSGLGDFVVSGNTMQDRNDGSLAFIRRNVGEQDYDTWQFTFTINARGADDPGVIALQDAAGVDVMSFSPARESAVDSSRRPMFVFGAGTSGPVLYASALTIGTQYVVECDIFRDVDHFSARLYAAGVLIGEIENESMAGSTNAVKYLGFATQSGDSSGKVTWSAISLSYRALSGNMNPAHIVYQVLTAPAQDEGETGVGIPVSLIDDDSFRSAADTFYGEGMGLCLQWGDQRTAEEFLQVVLDHCGAILRTDNATGKLQLVPVRQDYIPGDLPSYDEGEIIELDSFERVGYGELIGEVVVTYRDKVTNKDTVMSVQNLAVIQSQNGVVSESVAYPGIPTAALAARVAMRDLRARSVPIARGSVKLNRNAYATAPGDVFKLTWAKLGLSALICRAVEVDLGTLEDGTITVQFVEDVFGLPSSVYATEQASGWTDPSADPEAVDTQTALEMPYWFVRETLGSAEAAALAADDGYAFPLAVQPQDLATGFNLWSRVSPADYDDVSYDNNWTSTALLNGAVARGTTSLVIDNSTLDDADDGDGLVGHLALIGTGALAEIVRITGGNLTTGLTVTRGHLDTTPQEHADNTRIWLLAEPAMLDDTLRSAASSPVDTVNFKLATITGGGVLDIASATATSVSMASRSYRPVAPGDIEINSQAFPSQIDASVTVTWAHRDRANHIDTTLQTDTGITSEGGVTYNAYAYDDDSDVLLDSDTGLSGTTWSPTIPSPCNLRIELESERGGYVSWQRQVRVFEYTVGALLLEDGTPMLAEDGTIIQLES